MRHNTVTTRRIALIAGVLLALLGTGAGVYAASLGPSFTLKVTNGRTAFAAGQLGGYRVDVDRIRGHEGPVTLRVRNLPRGAKHFWVLSDDRALPRARFVRAGARRVSEQAVVLDPKHERAFLVVQASEDTNLGQTNPVIVAKSGRIIRKHRTWMGIRQTQRFTAASRRPQVDDAGLATLGLDTDFRANRRVTVAAAPARRSVVQSDATSFALELSRTEGTPAPTLSVAGLPAGATASFDPANPVEGTSAVMTVETTRDTPVGAYDVTITSTADGATASTATTLDVTALQDFTITGDVLEPLTLGATRTVPLTLENPYDFDLVVEDLVLAVDTANAGCDAAANFPIRQPDLSEPVVLPPGTSSFEELVDGPDRLPAVTWTNLDAEQNACLGAKLDFTYSGLARKR
jgi:hypothetical protein